MSRNLIYPPITFSIGFVEYALESSVQAFVKWKKEVVNEVHQCKRIIGDFPAVLKELKPLCTPYRKVLFLETDSTWTAVFFNEKYGQGCPEHMERLSAILNCRSIFAFHAPHMTGQSGSTSANDTYGGTILSINDPRCKGVINEVRSIYLGHDGTKWEFETFGQIQPFENPDYYRKRKKTDRFNREILDEYLGHFGIRFFCPRFYMPPGRERCILVA